MSKINQLEIKFKALDLMLINRWPNLDELEKTFEDSNKTKVILAKTIKGKGFSIMENKPNWHYWNNISDEDIEKCRKEINI